MKKTIMIATTLALSGIVGCGTRHGLGKDIGRAGDAMAGEGKHVMTDQATPAARRAVEQLPKNVAAERRAILGQDTCRSGVANRRTNL